MSAEPHHAAALCTVQQALPVLYCPFTSRISPLHDQVESANLHWLRRFGFARSDAADARLRAAGFGRLAARAYPSASYEGLLVAAAWASWLFLWDDRCDEEGIGRDPRAVRARSAQHLAVLAGRRRARAEDSLEAALSDLSERMVAKAGISWMARFLSNTADYFEATAWEAENRSRRGVPDTASYVRLRDLTGAVKTCFDVHELADGAVLPVQYRLQPLLTRMTQLANRAICWSNDIFSYEKELQQGDCHNLVLIIAHNSQLGRNEAIQRAVHMHDAAVRAFERLEAVLVRTGALPTPVACFIEALKGWMRANLDWSVETGRYARPDARA